MEGRREGVEGRREERTVVTQDGTDNTELRR